MAQWSRTDRTLFTKIVYYGPAFGGKTTNLETLHRLTDPEGRNQLLTLKTAADRTLFFDLLPFDLGEILGYQVGVKLYTVPGQVRYETTRQVVLAGSDALVFVADSTAEREEQNRWSLQNLKMNMRAKRLDPAQVPLLIQFNKQDLPGAASPEEVAGWFGMNAGQGIPAVATRGEGVLETFMAATRAMLHRLILLADERTRRGIDAEALEEHLEQAFAPFRERAHSAISGDAPSPEPALDATLPIVLGDEDLLQDSIEASVDLGDRLSTATSRMRRLELEAESLRRLSGALRKVGSSFDAVAIVDAVLKSALEILPAGAVSLLVRDQGGYRAQRVLGRREEPILDDPTANRLLDTLVASDERSQSDLPSVLMAPQVLAQLGSIHGMIVAPVDGAEPSVLVAYLEGPERQCRPEDKRFLTTLAADLSVGLEKARLYADLDRQNQGLEQEVRRRTKELERAYESLRQLDDLKHRFIGNVSHEMKTPLTAILSSTLLMRDYELQADERKELVHSVHGAAEKLQVLLSNLFRVVEMERDDLRLNYEPLDARDIVRDAIALTGLPTQRFAARGHATAVQADRARLARAIANLCDNAVKFSGADRRVEIVIEGTQLDGDGEPTSAIAFSVLDRGRGVDVHDRARLFQPMEQGGDPLRNKPEGLGLGLHEARIIAERHGGVIGYEPRAGGGSRFRITVPIEAPSSSLAAAS